MSTELREEVIRAEARAAWLSEEKRLALPPMGAAIVLGATVSTGAFAIAAVAVRIGMPLSDRPGDGSIAWGLGGAAAIAALAVPIALVHKRRALARAEVERARTRLGPTACPRCDAPWCERGTDEVVVRRCDACGARLLEAEGLLVAHTSSAFWRRRRWRAQARQKLAQRPRADWALSPISWMSATIGAMAILMAAALAIGEAPHRTLAASFAMDRQESLRGPSLDLADHAVASESALAPGLSTRPHAPLWMGTQVLARRAGPYFESAVIVAVDPPHAFVVYASGDSNWVGARDLLAPELAPGDRIEVRRHRVYERAELVRRIGQALLVELDDGTRVWTNTARVRVRSDAHHRTGEGRHADVPPDDAWIELRDGASRRPALLVENAPDQSTVHVVLGDGSARWVLRNDIDAQRIGPGTRVRVDDREVIVAARIGDALCVVDGSGRRSWTSLARVRRDS